VALSPPSVLRRAAWSSALGKGGTDKACPPHHYARGNVTGARPSSWRPSLPPASGELAILSSRWYGRRTRGRAWPPAERTDPRVSRLVSGRGGDLEGHLVLSRRDLLSNLSGILEADGLTHLLYLTPCLVHLLGGPSGGPTLAASGNPMFHCCDNDTHNMYRGRHIYRT